MIRVVEGRIDVEPGLSLVDALLDELRSRYDAEDDDAPSADDLAPPSGIFFVVFQDDAAIGCGGLKHFDDGIGEVS